MRMVFTAKSSIQVCGNDAVQMRGSFSGEQLMGCAPPLGPGVCVSCDNGELIVRQHHQAFLRRGCRICIQKVMQESQDG